MPLLCPKCGYENKDNYRFCGMCGGVFPVAPPAGKDAAASGRGPVSETQTSARDAAYLLEDDAPAPSHGRMYLALILLVVSGLLLVWHWRRDGYPWSPSSGNQSESTTTPAAVDETAKSQATAPAPVASAPVTSTPTPASSTAETDASQAAKQDPQLPPATTPADASPVQSESPSREANSDAETAVATEPVGSTEQADKEQEKKTSASNKTVSFEKPAPSRPAAPPAPAPAPLSADDRLIADGEKYLYGNGVPQDCDRATRTLKAAAGHSSPKALSLLGSMYASGNCVSRDLPTAYRWFAQALHADPNNTRIERDLELIWNQLTPGERQIAVRSGSQ